MAENKGMHIENLKQAGELLKSGKLDELVKGMGKFESEVKGIKSTLAEKLKALEVARKEKEVAEEVKAEEVAQVKPVEKPAKPQPVKEEVKSEKVAEKEQAPVQKPVEEKIERERRYIS